MLTLALAALLAVNDEVPTVSPPPLVPALPEAPRAPARARTRPEPPDEERIEEPQSPPQTDEEGFSARRVAISTGIAGATGAALVGGALWYAQSVHDSSGTPVALVLLSLPLSLFVGTGFAYASHRAMGGQGSYGAHLAGGALGGGIALLAAVLATTQLHDTPGVAAQAGFVIASGAVFGLATALMGESSHLRALDEAKAGVSVIPTRGGAVASVGFRF
jgi:hypothetical protein